MNNEDVYRNLIYWGMDFIKTDVWSRINNANHMNCFGNSIENIALGTENKALNPKNKGSVAKGELKDVQFIVAAVISHTKVTGSKKIDLLHDVERAVRKLRFFFLEEQACQIELDQDHIDAVLVEFVNYLGIRMWVDYAMYTCDLNEKAGHLSIQPSILSNYRD